MGGETIVRFRIWCTLFERFDSSVRLCYPMCYQWTYHSVAFNTWDTTKFSLDLIGHFEWHHLVDKGDTESLETKETRKKTFKLSSDHCICWCQDICSYSDDKTSVWNWSLIWKHYSYEDDLSWLLIWKHYSYEYDWSLWWICKLCII